LNEALEDFDLEERYFRQKFNIIRTRRIKTIAPIPTPAVGMWSSKIWNPLERSMAEEVILSFDSEAPMMIAWLIDEVVSGRSDSVLDDLDF
jgi:hypothetical protein